MTSKKAVERAPRNEMKIHLLDISLHYLTTYCNYNYYFADRGSHSPSDFVDVTWFLACQVKTGLSVHFFQILNTHNHEEKLDDTTYTAVERIIQTTSTKKL